MFLLMALVKSIYIEIYIFINYNDEKKFKQKNEGNSHKTKQNETKKTNLHTL